MNSVVPELCVERRVGCEGEEPVKDGLTKFSLRAPMPHGSVDGIVVYHPSPQLLEIWLSWWIHTWRRILEAKSRFFYCCTADSQADKDQNLLNNLKIDFSPPKSGIRFILMYSYSAYCLVSLWSFAQCDTFRQSLRSDLEPGRPIVVLPVVVAEQLPPRLHGGGRHGGRDHAEPVIHETADLRLPRG